MKQLNKKKTKKSFKEWGHDLLSFSWFDGWYEKTIHNDRSLKWLGVIIVAFIYANTQFITPITWDYAEDVRGKTLNAIYDTEKYVVEGLPKTVDFTLEGKESIVKSLVKADMFNAFVDLSHLKPGQHIVTIDYDVIPSIVKVGISPKNVSVLIKELSTVEKKVQLEYFNEALKDPIIELAPAVLSQEIVEVKGAKDKVEQIVAIKGMVDISDPSKLKDYKVELFAVDKQGNKLDVMITPSEILTTIESSIPQKEIPLSLNLTGKLPEGKLLKSSHVEPSKVVVYAPSSKLEELETLLLEADYSQISNNGRHSVAIEVPEGVTKIEPSEVQLDVQLVDEVKKTLKAVPIQVKGLDSSLKLANELTTTVVLNGFQEEISDIEATDLKLSVNLKDLKAGSHAVKLQLSEKLSPSISINLPSEINIQLLKK